MLGLDATTKAIFFGGIALGSILGLLSSFVITLFFKIYDNVPCSDRNQALRIEKIVFAFSLLGYAVLTGSAIYYFWVNA